MLSLTGATCLELNAGPGTPISLSHPDPHPPTVGTLFTGWVHLDEPQGYPYDSSLLHTSPYAFTFDLLTGATSKSWIASASSSALPAHPFPAFAPLGGGTHKGPHPGATQFPLCAYTDTQLDPAHIPFAYSFALLAPVEGSASPHPAPKSWELQGSRGGATGWVTLDTRKSPSSTGGVLNSTSPEEPWVAFIPPHATGVGFTALRLIVRDVVGARGSHSVVWPSPGGVTLTSAQVWMAPPPPPPSVPPAMPPSPPCLLPVCLPRWIVSVSGSWGYRRLRVTTSDGAIDCVSVGVLDTHEGSPGFYLGVGVGTGEGERGEWHWHVEVHINGRPVPMKSVEECIRVEPLSSCLSSASISSTSSIDGGGSLIINHYRKALNVDLLQEGGGLVEEQCTPSVAAEGGSGSGGGGGCHPAPPPCLTWSHPSTTTTLVLGGALGKEAVTLAVQKLQQQQDSAAPLPQWLYIRNHLTPFTPLAPKGALARDAPRDMTTPPLRGALARLSLVQCGPLPASTPSPPPTWRALREALTGLYREVINISGRGGKRLPSHRRQLNLFPRYPPFTQPFHTLEGMALWQPFPPSSSLPPPIRPRYPPHTIGACTSITITSGGGSAGGKEGGIHTTPPLGAFARGCATGHLSPHKPITLLCHDCGPSVYIEDVWEGGTPVRPLPLLPAQQGGGQQEGHGHKQQPPLPLPRSSPFFALPPMQPSTTPIPPPLPTTPPPNPLPTWAMPPGLSTP